MAKEGRKENLLMRATTEIDWHVNVWSEQINGPQIYQDKQWPDGQAFESWDVAWASGH